MSTEYLSTRGVISANGGIVRQTLNDGSGIGVDIRGPFVGTLSFEVSIDGENWSSISLLTGLTLALVNSSTTTAGSFFGNVSCANNFRVRATAWTSGSAQVIIKTSDDPMYVITMPVSGSTSVAASSTLFGDVGLQYRASATGSATSASVLSPATPAGAVVKGSAGKVVGIMLTNTSAAVRSVKFYNAASVTMGTTAAMFEVDIPVNGTYMFNLEGGIAFTTGIAWAVTSAKGLTDNTATGLAANDVSGVIFYA